MQLDGYRESSNTESRGGLGGMVMGGGVGTLLLAGVALFMGVDPRIVLSVLSNAPRRQETRPAPPDDAATAAKKQFVRKVLATTEDCWDEQMVGKYSPPLLVFFQGQVRSACGLGQDAMGPFYCGSDRNIYIDLSFYDDLRDKLGAPGDFAQAYVIAHEVGHHVQNLRGTLDRVHQLQARSSRKQANELSVRLELQADFYAGVWGNYVKRHNLLEVGDLEEALNAATAIGDDRLQSRSGGRVVPDSFTHGTSEQRLRWFRKGFDSGDPNQGDTFSARQL